MMILSVVMWSTHAHSRQNLAHFYLNTGFKAGRYFLVYNAGDNFISDLYWVNSRDVSLCLLIPPLALSLLSINRRVLSNLMFFSWKTESKNVSVNFFECIYDGSSMGSDICSV